MKFSRVIKSTDDRLNYIENRVDKEKRLIRKFNNCHFGSMKLTYSELEFFTYCSKYIDINKCLVVYIGAQPGYRLKHIFTNYLFSNIKFLLYDPLPFNIKNDDNFIIKTGKDGWFNETKIQEVLDIANGRKILYISDIRNDNPSELDIYHDLLKQQKYGTLLGAEFMLLKFRTFFYKNDPNEIDFINNDEGLNDKMIYNKNEFKHNSKSNYFLYLDGKIYTQIYQGRASTETRLLVKKLKYYKNKQDGEKYKLKYYNNIKYEQILYYFNNYTRQMDFSYKDSSKLAKFLPNGKNDYTIASEYKIVYDYCKYFLKLDNVKFKNVLNIVLQIHLILSSKYNNNRIKCIYTSMYHVLQDKIPRAIQFKKELKEKVEKYKKFILKTRKIKDMNIKKNILKYLI